MRRSLVAAVAVLTAAVLIAACGSSSNSSSSSSSSTTAAKKKANIAYLSFAVANSYDAPMLAAAQTVAKGAGASLTVLDANNDPKAQFAQLQNATASGKYNAIVVQPIFGTGLITGVQDAIGKGIKVVNLDQILGPDLTTDQPQVKGLSGNVVFVPTEIGQKLGNLVVKACQANNLNPCNVGYLFDIKASALDVAIKKAFDQATSGKIKVVAQGESFFTPAKGLAATQNMLQAHPEINAVYGSNESTTRGALGALEQAKKLGQIKFVGFDSSAELVDALDKGTIQALVLQDPVQMGYLSVKAAVAAIRGQTVAKEQPIAPVLVTQENKNKPEVQQLLRPTLD